MPLYYGFLMVADAIGSTGDASVAEVETNSSTIAAYGIYEGSHLARLVLSNTEPWTGADEEGKTRPSTFLSITLPSSSTSIKSARLKTLAVDSILSMKGLTWGGQSWETLSGLPSGEETFQALEVGSASGGGTTIGLKIDTSSVGIVYFD
ncbi:glycosyl hydrolase family 79 C-terminal domain-containing protein [Aspergillus stella-maris]|uniref:glycosyl hydrolase family 79 C-terminal domain-containing protein n=1 Tax=Aspergillus stella-maris TaxID=1810926 RepID=UPI003CCD7F2C